MLKARTDQNRSLKIVCGTFGGLSVPLGLRRERILARPWINPGHEGAFGASTRAPPVTVGKADQMTYYN